MNNNDGVQPVDEISPASKELDDQWIVNIETLVEGYDTEEIPPTRPPIEEIPSIYGNWACLNDFGDVMSFLPQTDRGQFVAFMKRAFDLKARECLEELHKNEDKVWRYYGGVDEQFRTAENSKSFIERLLVNSCFVIFALVTLTSNWQQNKKISGFAKNDDTKMPTFNGYKKLQKFIRGERVGIWRYMLTMEYQIPWFVVEAVYTKHSNLSSKLNTPIHELVISAFNLIKPGVAKSKLHNNTITVPQYGFQHVLHIFHWSRTPKEKFHEIIPFVDMRSFDIPIATDMQLCASVFNRHDVSGFDVTFYEGILSGVIQLPPWSHFLYENEIYKNLLAFEREYGMVCGFSVTAYVACIVNFIQTEEDVTLLQAKRIIPRLGDPKDFWSSIQEYKTILCSNDIPMSDDLAELMFQLRSYKNERSIIKKNYAEFMKRYCPDTWITLSVIAGILLFILTFLQTLYGMLSYYNQ